MIYTVNVNLRKLICPTRRQYFFAHSELRMVSENAIIQAVNDPHWLIWMNGDWTWDDREDKDGFMYWRRPGYVLRVMSWVPFGFLNSFTTRSRAISHGAMVDPQ
jgi:hypothetical protein